MPSDRLGPAVQPVSKALELPWLATPWRKAATALAGGRIPAGWLILGHPGLGRNRLADAIVAARLCEQPDRSGAPCGSCKSCRLVVAGSHPDLLRVVPEEAGRAVRVEQIRELSRALSLTSGRSGARCAVISPADQMTDSAENSLLKTLEEPGAGAMLVLVASGTAALRPTIVSRCLRLEVVAPPRAEALRWLHEQWPREDWEIFLSLGGGAPLAARELAEAWPEDARELIARLIGAAAGQQDPVGVASAFSGWSLAHLAALVSWLARGALRGSLLRDRPRQASEWPPALRGMANRADPRSLVRVWRAARLLARDSASVNAMLARERLILLFVDAFAEAPQGAGRIG